MTAPRRSDPSKAPPGRPASQTDSKRPVPEKRAARAGAVRHCVAFGELDSPEAILKRQLARRGDKYTKARREILEAVVATHQHIYADGLYLRLRGQRSKVSKATVYRTLSLLCECGLMRKVFHGPHGAYYEHVYGHEHHEHMMCLNCGNVIEFGSRRLEQLQEDACRAHGFHAVRHHLQIFGYCAECHSRKDSVPTRRPRPSRG